MDGKDVRVEYHVYIKDPADMLSKWRGEANIFYPGGGSVRYTPDVRIIGSTKFTTTWGLRRAVRKAIALYRSEQSGMTSERKWEETF